MNRNFSPASVRKMLSQAGRPAGGRSSELPPRAAAPYLTTMAHRATFAAALWLCATSRACHGAAVKLVPVMEKGAVSVGCTSNVRCPA
eukprot:COSAG01_NODE_429_length_17183_cov_22.990869_3_plen_88_part_00